jgi:fucose permease
MNPLRIRLLCRFGMAGIAYGPMLMPVYLTTYASAFGGLDEAQLGRIPAVLFAAALASILVTGPMADRIGARFFTVLGPALVSAGLFTITLAPSYAMLLAGSALLGAGAGMLDNMMSPIIAAVSGARRASELNGLHAYYCVGAVGITAVAAGGLYFELPWRAVMATLALGPAGLAIAFAITPLPALIAEGMQRARLRVLLRNPRMYAALLAMALAGATEEGMTQWLPAYAERALGYDRAISGFGLTVFAVLMGVGRFAGVGLVERHGTHRIVITATLTAACLYAAGALLPWAPVAFAACILLGLFCSVLWPTMLGMTANRIPFGGASMFAMLSMGGVAGNLTAPWLTGKIAAATSLPAAIFAGAAFPLVLALLTLLLLRVDRQSLGISHP